MTCHTAKIEKLIPSATYLPHLEPESFHVDKITDLLIYTAMGAANQY